MSIQEKTAISILVLIDISTKLLAKFLGVGIKNCGITFGYFGDISQIWIYIFDFSLLILVFILRKFLVLDKISKIGLDIMLSGAIANLIWRLVFGHVLQWIDLMYIPTFNLADLMIIIGASLTIFSVVWHGIE